MTPQPLSLVTCAVLLGICLGLPVGMLVVRGLQEWCW